MVERMEVGGGMITGMDRRIDASRQRHLVQVGQEKKKESL